jgi:membrane protease subunit HflC
MMAEAQARSPGPAPRPRRLVLAASGCAVLLALVLAAALVPVEAGTAVVVTEFGRPVRVILAPGLSWKLPSPVQSASVVDLRLHTTSGTVQEVATKDGLRILVQAYAIWSVRDDPTSVLQFVRGMRNDPAEAARQLGGALDASLQDAAAGFDLADLVNADPARLGLPAFEAKLGAALTDTARQLEGVTIRQVGVERLSMRDTTRLATVSRMQAEQDILAAQRRAEGAREAAQIRAEAARDGRILVADARVQAAQIEAESRRQAAEIQGRAYEADPQLYMLLRSLDTLSLMIGPNTRLVLRTDAAPFNVLVQGPPSGAPP